MWNTTVHASFAFSSLQAASSILQLRAAQGSGVRLSGPLGKPYTTEELARMYDASTGSMRPTPTAPKPRPEGGTKKGANTVMIAACGGLHETLREQVVRMVAEGDADEDDLQGGVHSGQQAQACSSGREGEGFGTEKLSEAEMAAGEALGRFFVGARRHELNSDLRKEKALMVERVKRFHIHLQQQVVANQAAGGKGKGGVQGHANVGKDSGVSGKQKAAGLQVIGKGLRQR